MIRLAILNFSFACFLAWAWSLGYVGFVFSHDVSHISYLITALFAVSMAAVFLGKTSHLERVEVWLVTLGLIANVIGFVIALHDIDTNALGTSEGVQKVAAHLHPQLFELPLFRFRPPTAVSFPQSHRQCQPCSRGRICPAYPCTTSRPNLNPVRFLKRLSFGIETSEATLHLLSVGSVRARRRPASLRRVRFCSLGTAECPLIRHRHSARASEFLPG